MSDTKEVNATPKILIIVPNYWGKGETIAEAWQQVKKASYSNLRDLKRGKWAMYSGHDTEAVKMHVDDFGSVCHDRDYPLTEIEVHGVK